MQSVNDAVVRTLHATWDYVSSANFLYSPVYLISAGLIVFIVWRRSGTKTSFWRHLFPREYYYHPSTRVDIQVTILNLIIFGSGVLSVFFFGPIVAWGLLDVLTSLWGSPVPQETTLAGGVAAALILILVGDFCRYLVHYCHHKALVLWPFHAVHHSAEVMTPITFYRGHPVYYALQQVVMSVLIGTTQAIILFLLVGHIELWVIYLGTLVYHAYIFLGGHLRHSHIPIRYGRALEHLLISPMQHQVHHSSDPKHHDKNFGEIFAIWDWMFGTLYIPDASEDLTFGIADSKGVLIEQPHPGFWKAMLVPFRDSWDEMRGLIARRKTAATVPEEL